MSSKGRCAQFLAYMSEQCMFLCKQHDPWTDDMLGRTHVDITGLPNAGRVLSYIRVIYF